MCGHALVNKWIQPGMIAEFQIKEHSKCPKCEAEGDELVKAAQDTFDAIAVSWGVDDG